VYETVPTTLAIGVVGLEEVGVEEPDIEVGVGEEDVIVENGASGGRLAEYCEMEAAEKSRALLATGSVFALAFPPFFSFSGFVGDLWGEMGLKENQSGVLRPVGVWGGIGEQEGEETE